MKILALDLSLTATGWASGVSLGNGVGLTHGTETNPGKLRGVRRLEAWHHFLQAILSVRRPDLVVIEGYSYASKNQAHQMGEWGGIARLAIHQTGVSFAVIAPPTLKKFATGNGSCAKPDMRMELYKRSGLDVADDNTVDALWLLAAARERYGEPLWSMPKANVEALGKVDWPEIG